MENKRTEQEKLVLDNYEWDLLVKQLSSIVNKATKIQTISKHPTLYRKQGQLIKIKALECLNIIKYKDLKND